MKFKDFKEKNNSNYDFFTADEMSYKEFVQLSFKEFLTSDSGSKWQLDIDDKRFNSFPNFTQKHQICISNLDYKDNVFQFRICSENNVSSLGYRMFTSFDSAHKDFVTDDIKHSDEVMMSLKLGELKEFPCISKCGWWIKDIWRDMYPILDETSSEDFVADIIKNEFTKKMTEINECLKNAQDSGKLDEVIAKLQAKIN